MIINRPTCNTHLLNIRKYLDRLPPWMKSTALQQGIVFGAVSLLSLLMMASITLWYVENELDDQNLKIFETTQQLVQGMAFEIDDDLIDDDDILEMMTSGFIFSGLLVSLLTSALVIAMTMLSQTRINRIERVLNSIAEGDLSARTGERHTYNDLARISVSVDEMLSRLQGSVVAMSDISSNIAHELKTPLTRLNHVLLILKEEANKAPEAYGPIFLKELDHALDDSQGLANIFDALLRISQIESGARRSRFSIIDLNQVIDTISEIYSDVVEDANMHLIVNKCSPTLMINGDKELLIQQMANLIENALRYCPKGSEIRLSCGNDHIEKQVWIMLEDDGGGISDENKERVFERLYRVDKSRTDAGLGLGLTFAKAVTGLHHGTITLHDCNPGLGVYIRLPKND